MSGAENDAVARWRGAQAPSLDDIAALAEDAFARLPETFRSLCEGVVFVVEEFADDETLDSLGIESEYDLLGLYHGVAISHDDGMRADANRIHLYRRALIDYWAEYDETFDHLVTHVLVHEIGHHVGLSDDQMEYIENSVR
ncbi:MAG: metallopeptidase family protein [Pseudomonadota bacterium]